MQVGLAVAAFFLIHSTAMVFAVRVWMSESWIREDVDSVQRAVAEKRFDKVNDIRSSWSNGIRMGSFAEPELKYVLDEGRTIIWQTARGLAFFQPPYVWDGGLMYCESGDPPTGWSEFYVDHLYGPWWRWRMGD